MSQIVDKDAILIKKRDSHGRFVKQYDDDTLDSDPLVQDWLNSYESKETRYTYLSQFRHFITEIGLSPQEYLDLDINKSRSILVAKIREYRDQERHSKAKATADAVRAFMKYHYKPIQLRRQDVPRRIRKKLNSGLEHVPTEDEIYGMVEASNKERNKALIMVLFQSGIRVNALRRLTLGMLRPYLYPEIDAPIPLQITSDIDTKLRSSEISYYYTFIARDGAEYLKNYTDQLMDEPDECRLFGLDNSRICQIIKRLAKKIGIDPKTVWTHLLRKSFRKVLNRSTLDEDTKEAIMGHRLAGSRGNYFDHADLNEIRSKYARLDFRNQNVEVRELQRELERESQIRRMLESQLRYMDQTFEKRVKDSFDVMMAQQTYERTIIPTHELHKVQQFLEQGWEIELPNRTSVLLRKVLNQAPNGKIP